jgi:putative restriction endonuclease
VRVNQHLFRSIILAGYSFQCAVCTLPISSLLVAAHIVPWSRDKSLRMNPRNGICLCTLHDRAFDAGLLVISAHYRIAIHPRAQQFKDNAAVSGFLLAFSGKSISLPERWRPPADFLNRHAQMISSSV